MSDCMSPICGMAGELCSSCAKDKRIAELKAVVAEMGEDTRLGNQAIGYGTVVVSNYLERFEEILEGASDDKR